MAKAKEVGIADEVGKYMKMHLDSMLKQQVSVSGHMLVSDLDQNPDQKALYLNPNLKALYLKVNQKATSWVMVEVLILVSALIE